MTGAGGGLGRCHALELARRGARVVVNDLGSTVDGSGASTSAAQAWAIENLDQPLSLRVLASKQAMSVRTFARKFTADVGMSPAKWIVQQRLHRARELLENTDHTIDKVAAEAGFGTATSMRQHLMAEIGVSPSAYRATFAAHTIAPPMNPQAAQSEPVRTLFRP